MAKRRAATRVILTDAQRERLERLWFIYGNYGPKTTPGNHQFIQGLLEHGLDLRPLQTKRTAKREKPTEECEAAVEAILASPDAAVKGAARFALLKLAPSPDVERKAQAPDQELKRMLDEMRRRLPADGGRGGFDAGGKDAA
ncbi:MAG: hypothetical protein ABW250_12905 [Pyrinomonadaceae bacterium]